MVLFRKKDLYVSARVTYRILISLAVMRENCRASFIITSDINSSLPRLIPA